MKYLTFAFPEETARPRYGVLFDDTVLDLQAVGLWAQAARGLPRQDLSETLFEHIHAGPAAWAYARNLINALEGEDPNQINAGERPVGFPLDRILVYPPLPRPTSLRDFYAFEAHVAAANANRRRKIPTEWYEFPVFYFSNPNAIFGPGEAIPYPAASQELDYELEVACVIGKAGRDIQEADAEVHIFGYTIFNDWSARDVQRREMRVGLGPAKGKDFASSLGPWIVTPDELSDRSTGRPGVYDLAMTAQVNGQARSQGNWRELHYSFGGMIARASTDAYLLPGDVLGSGTVGTGCLLELTRGEGPWLQPGDVVSLEVERLGVLENQIAAPVRAAPMK